MTKKPTHQNGLSKKELIKIIEKIDAAKNNMKNHNQKPGTSSEKNSFKLSSNTN